MGSLGWEAFGLRTAIFVLFSLFEALLMSQKLQKTALRGSLFVYQEGVPPKVAFAAGDEAALHDTALVFIHGVPGSFHDAPYIPSLANLCERLSISLVLPLLRSSLQCYGFHTLHTDVEDLDELLDVLIEAGVQRVILLGFSTGAQDSVFYAKHGKHKSRLAALILHGPASDRLASEAELGAEKLNAEVAAAKALVAAGNGKQFMTERLYGSDPVNAERFVALCSSDGDDDMFSRDLSDTVLCERLGHCASLPVLSVLCGSDEFCPKDFDYELEGKRLATALSNGAAIAFHSQSDERMRHFECGDAKKFVTIVNDSDHTLTKVAHYEAFLDRLRRFLVDDLPTPPHTTK